MKLEFKTVKEFLGFLTQDDFSFVEHYCVNSYDYVCFEIDTNSIGVYVYNSEYDWEISREFIDSIYGTFFEDGGSLSINAENNWDIPFSITEDTLNVGSVYKIKVPKTETTNP